VEPADLTRVPIILAEYSLHDLWLVGEIDGGTRNHNFLVADDGGLKYVLRHYRKHADSTFVHFTLEFQCYLLAEGFPTPRVFASRAAALLVRAPDGCWALSEFIEGEHFQLNRYDQIAEAGRRLAQFHGLARGFPGPVATDEVSENVRLWWTQGARELDQIAERYSGQGLDDELRLFRDWHAETLAAWPLERLDSLPGGLVHLDWHGRNMVFVDDRVVGVFDFDGLSQGFPVHDVAQGVLAFGREKRGSLQVRGDAARTFLAAYEEQHPLTAEERRAIPLFLSIPGAPIYTWMLMLERIGLDPVRHLRAEVARKLSLRNDLAWIREIVDASA
jgi:Ser/Thr protein kinase RdoA (MazF antagonist)